MGGRDDSRNDGGAGEAPPPLDSSPALRKQWSRDFPADVPAVPTLPDADLRYQAALDWRKWTNGGCSFRLCQRSFDRAVMVEEGIFHAPSLFDLRSPLLRQEAELASRATHSIVAAAETHPSGSKFGGCKRALPDLGPCPGKIDHNVGNR